MIMLSMAPVNRMEETAGEAIAGGLEDGAMKEKVGGNELDAVGAFAVLKIGNGLPEQCDIVRGGAFGSLGGERRFHEEAKLGQLLHARIVEQEEELHGNGKDRGRIAIQVTAVADLLGDDAHDFEDLQGLAKR